MKRGIEIVVFVSGMILMALEIAGGRLLIFNYGGSVYVWGSIIAVILGGLSIGYYSGGRLADKKPQEKVLSSLILIAALLILIIPLSYSKLVSLIENIPNMISPLLVIILLFFLPSVLLGMVSPFAIKLKAKRLEKIGKTSGNLYALATIGSVIGTFITTFVLILFIPITQIFFILTTSLIAVALVLKKNKRFYLICIIILLIVFSISFSNKSLINVPLKFQEGITGNVLEGKDIDITFESAYGPVRIKDKNDVREMFISGGVMGAMHKKNKFLPVKVWNYLDFMVKASLISSPKNVLVLGVGAGIIPTRLNEQYNVTVDAVDINKVVLEAAHSYFGLNPSETLKVYNKDARVFLKQSNKKYDVIAMDIFKYSNYNYIIPPHLTTQEYLELVKWHLKENGIFIIMIVNEGREKDFFGSEYKTISSVFENTYVFETYNDILVIVASDKEIGFSEELLKYNYTKEIPYGIIYTDDYVPLVYH